MLFVAVSLLLLVAGLALGFWEDRTVHSGAAERRDPDTLERLGIHRDPGEQLTAFFHHQPARPEQERSHAHTLADPRAG